MTGTLVAGGSPPLAVPSGTSGYVLMSDGSGNITLNPAPGGGIALVPTAKSANYTASSGDLVVCNATSASFTVTLPNAPANGSVVGAKMTATASSHTVSIACAGSDVFNVSGGATTLTLSLLMQGMILQYASGIWYVTSDDLPLGQLDARYLQQSGGTVSGTVTLSGSPPIKLPTGTSGYVLASDGSGNLNLASLSGVSGMANPMTTSGDIITGGSSGNPGRLGVGSTGQVLTVSGGAPAWAGLPAASTSQSGVVELDGTNSDIAALGASASAGTGSLAAISTHVHPNTGLALLSGAAFTGAVSTTKALTSGVVALTYASTITVNAALGNTFRVTLTGNATMATPSNPADGQMILFEITQDATGGRTLAWSAAYVAGTDVAFPTLSTTAGRIDTFGYKYYAANNVWRLLAYARGFSQ